MSTKLDLWKLIVGLCLAGAGFESVSAEAAILILQPDAIVGKDAQLVDDQPTTNLGGDVDLIANWFSNSRAIGLIQFDFSAIPAGATINSATLSLFQRYNDSSNETYDLFRVTSVWDEGTVTFNTAPTFDPIASSSMTIGDPGAGVFRSWSVAGLVAGWHAGSFSNFGMWIEEIPIKGNGSAYFGSSDAPESQRPILAVEYTPVPEPGSLAVCLTITGLAFCGTRSRRRATSAPAYSFQAQGSECESRGE